MTDKQIDRNNQVEVGLNIAKELLELHKIFEDEVEKNPYVIQTDFIKSKLFYFYQRADWLNVCFKLLEQQLSRKEQECEELKKELQKNFEEKDTLHLIIDRLLEASGYDTNTASAEDFEDVYEHMRYEQQQLDQLKADRKEALKQLEFVRTLNTVKEAEIRKLSKTLTEIKEIAEDESYIGFWDEQISKILQKISEVEDEK